MDILRKYAFWVVIGAATVAIIVLYFVTVVPVRASNWRKAREIRASLDKLKTYSNKGDKIITPELAKHEEIKKKELDAQYGELVKWYLEEGKSIESYKVPGVTELEDGKRDPFVFNERYQQELKKLVEAYKKRFGEDFNESGVISLPQPSDTAWTQEQMKVIEKLLFLHWAFLDIMKEEYDITSLQSLKFALGKLLPRGGLTAPAPGSRAPRGTMPGTIPGGVMPGGAMPPGGMPPGGMPPGGMPGGMTYPGGTMPFTGAGGMSGAGPGRGKLEIEEVSGGLFQSIDFTLRVRMNLQLLPELMANILERRQMKPEFGMFTDIKSVTFQAVQRHGKVKFPEVDVEIDGVVLDFVEKKVAPEKKSKETGKKPMPRR